MFHTFITRFSSTIALGVILFVFSAPASVQADGPKLVAPLKELFSHSKHKEVFFEQKRACTSCHDFSKRSSDSGPTGEPAGPTGEPVGAGHLKAPKESCHDCHKGPSPAKGMKTNSCLICHSSHQSLAPEDHALSWKTRHGRYSQQDPAACKKCHMPRDCDQCHSYRDFLNPAAHPGNFRYIHSIAARANPASCITCHKSQTYCVDCHSQSQSKKGGPKR